MPNPIDMPVPFIDPNRDPAIFVKALSSQTLPAPTSQGKVRKYAGYANYTTHREWVDFLNKRFPHEVYFEETSLQDWADKVPIPGVGLELGEMWKYVEEVGYFGGDKGGTRIITEVRTAKTQMGLATDIVTVEVRGGAYKDRRLGQESGLVDSRRIEQILCYLGYSELQLEYEVMAAKGP